jgi:hypothetical protein
MLNEFKREKAGPCVSTADARQDAEGWLDGLAREASPFTDANEGRQQRRPSSLFAVQRRLFQYR